MLMNFLARNRFLFFFQENEPERRCFGGGGGKVFFLKIGPDEIIGERDFLAVGKVILT